MTVSTPITPTPSSSNELFAPVTQVYAHLDNQVASLQQRYASHMQCKAGCSNCCIDGFKVRLVEALVVWHALCQLPTETLATVLAKIQKPKTGDSLSQCPLLSDTGQCSVYNARPALCRAFGVLVKLEDTVATCDLNFTKLPTTPQLDVLDLVPYYAVLDELSIIMASVVGEERLWNEPKPLKMWLKQFFQLG